MEWFSKKTSIAGVEIPNWAVALSCRPCNLTRLLIHALSGSGSNPTRIFKSGH